MAGLREMKKRLRSIQTTGQLAGAMRSASAAKYARAGAAHSRYAAYAATCQTLLARAGGAAALPHAETEDARPCLVVISGNRGLCGGFNTELLGAVSAQLLNAAEPPLIIACGKIAIAYCTEKRLKAEQTFPLSDIPSYEEAQAIVACVRGLYESGAASGVTFVYQSFHNMLTQTPAKKQLLPLPAAEEQESADDMLFLPDRETVCRSLAVTCLCAEIYAIVLENATGAQAATLMAMRAAYDNATKSAAKLETAINRRRQAEVTAGVIETSSENRQ